MTGSTGEQTDRRSTQDAGGTGGRGPGRPSSAPGMLGMMRTLLPGMAELRGNMRQYGMIMALALIVVLFQVLTVVREGQDFVTPRNTANIITQNSYILVLAIGMMMVIVAGHIDLSVGSVLALTGAVAAQAISSWGFSWPMAAVLCLAVGALIGAWQGFWVAYMGVPAFIVTLAGMLLFRGLTMVVLENRTVAGMPEGFRDLGAGYLPGGDISVPILGDLHAITVLLGVGAAAALMWVELRSRMRRASFGLPLSPTPLFIVKVAALVIVILAFSYLLADYEGIPIAGCILIGLIIVYSFVMNNMVAGRRVYAVGGNQKAAMLSGVNTKHVSFWVFVNMGVLGGLAGLLFTARLSGAQPNAGEMFELQAIAACFIGGASMAGGVGTIVGAIVGGLVMGVMNQGMNVHGVGSDWRNAILGSVLLLAVAFDVYNKNRAKAPSSGTTTESSQSTPS